jgi:hypothetical protein
MARPASPSRARSRVPSFNGLRYETARLTVDITYVRCNDAMSGHGYAHQVLGHG